MIENKYYILILVFIILLGIIFSLREPINITFRHSIENQALLDILKKEAKDFEREKSVIFLGQ